MQLHRRVDHLLRGLGGVELGHRRLARDPRGARVYGVLILLAAAVFLFLNLPDANAFNARVEKLFVENDDLKAGAEIKLLEILAQSGTSFSEVLTSYRSVIFVLLSAATMGSMT